MRSDPRVTRVGAVLRRYSLDELPQLLHVLTGRMSLVGPRPPMPEEVARYDEVELRRLRISLLVLVVASFLGLGKFPSNYINCIASFLLTV